MKSHIQKIISLLALGVVGFMPALSVFAADSTLPDSPIKSWQNVVDLLTKAATWMYQAFFIIAVIYFLWGAFTFLQAGGDTTKVAEGKKRILYGVIAVIVALLSTGAAQLIKSTITTAVGGN
jgi:hypothetical protein